MDIPTWNCMELPPRCWFLENFRVSEFELVLEGMMKPLRTQICWVGSELPHTLQHAIAYIYIYTWNFHPGIILDPGLRAWNFEPQIQFQTLMKISDPGMFGVFVI